MNFAYRFQQFWRNRTARPLSVEALAAITAVLTAEELALFQRFDLSDQQHSYRVFAALAAAGYNQPALLTAALLHDIGKTQYPLTVWERSLAVVMAMIAPQQVLRWGAGEAHGWRRPFAIKVQHPAWGADMVTAVGGCPQAAALIRRHQDVLSAAAASEEDELLRLLQWADDQN